MKIQHVRVGCIILLCLSMTACPPSGAPPPAPTTASLSVTIKNYISGGAGIQCPATVQWRLEPVNLTGAQGRDTAFDTVGNYSGTSSQIETSGPYPVYGCIYNDSHLGLKAGTWKIRGSNGAWTAECQKQISNSGFNTVQFTINQSGCA
jgi:hypothetical protein